MSELRLYLFGPPRLERDGTRVEVHRSKGLALLCYLALTKQPQSRDALATLLWPEADQSNARTNLRRDLSRLRQDLGESVLQVERDTLTLSPDTALWTDVDTFHTKIRRADQEQGFPERACNVCLESLTEATQLYTDHFMAGFTLPENPAFDEWQFFQADSLRLELADVLQRLTRWHSEQGETDQAVLYVRRWLALDPLHEPAHRHLMELYARSGQQAAALRQYAECVRLLEREVGITPDRETTELADAIRSKRFPVGSSTKAHISEQASPPTPSVSTAPSVGESPHTATPFVGRDQELALLLRAVEDVKVGQGQLVLIKGETGIGKSRLMEEVLRASRDQNVATLSEKCYRATQTMPYQVLIDLVTQALSRWPADTFSELAPASLAELALLVPEVTKTFPNLPPSPEVLAEARQARLFRAIQQLLTAPGERGLVLAVDDIHWADEVTLKFLNQLAYHLADQPLLLICTYRSEETATDERLSPAVYGLSRPPQGSHMTMPRISEADAAEFVTTLPATSQQTAEFGSWLYRETEGNPFFLTSLVRSLQEQGVLGTGDAMAQVDLQRLKTDDTLLTLPEALRESVRDRLRRLSKEARSTLDIAAVLGRRFDFETLQAITGEGPNALLDALEDMLARQLLREVDAGHAFDFNHDKIREVVYHDLSSRRRALLHRQVAETLEEAPDPHAEERSGTLADHFEQGQVWDKAITYLIRAARRAKGFFAMREALHYFDRVLTLVERHPDSYDPGCLPELHQGRGEARAEAGEFSGAIRDLQFALESRAASNPVLERELRATLGMIHRRLDHYREAKTQLGRALELARKEGNTHAVADILFHLGTVAFSQGDADQTESYYRQAADLCDREGYRDRIAVQARHGLGETSFLDGDVQAARKHLEASLALAREIGDRGYEAENLYLLASVDTEMLGADYRRAEACAREALSICESALLEWHRAPAMGLLGYVIGSTGRYQEGLEYLHRSRHLATKISATFFSSFALDFIGVLYRELNLLDRAQSAHTEGLELVSTTQAGNWLARLQANLAIDRLRHGDLGVESDLIAAAETAHKLGQNFHLALCLEGLAELALTREKAEEALKYASSLIDLTHPRGMRERLAQGYRWQAKAHLALGRTEQASASLKQATELAVAIDRPHLYWRVHDAMTELYLATGDRKAATFHRQQARSSIDRIAREIEDPTLRAGLPIA
ncbi:MAG: AAA family ATPase [Trueperaceae bacterium]|nr:MAG: AAA family ATPase [Trueperaceae bacterium]